MRNQCSFLVIIALFSMCLYLDLFMTYSTFPGISQDLWKIILKDLASSSASSFSILACNSSDPGDLNSFTLNSYPPTSVLPFHFFVHNCLIKHCCSQLPDKILSCYWEHRNHKSRYLFKLLAFSCPPWEVYIGVFSVCFSFKSSFDALDVLKLQQHRILFF